MDRSSAASLVSSVVVSGQPFDETLDFFTNAGFRLDRISPAEDPSLALVSRSSLSITIDRAVAPTPTTFELEVDESDLDRIGSELLGPNMATIRFVARPSIRIPPLVERYEVVKSAESSWIAGRAGMRYRDLLPSRLGGRFAASTIEVCDGGPVPDTVHYHGVEFQVICCIKGWVQVVYESQGHPFIMRTGDVVLQPPYIRHRVLSSSPSARVVEVSSPAQHDTFVDHELVLPVDECDPLRTTPEPSRLFTGQRFVHHVADQAEWRRWRHPGFEVQISAISGATNGTAGVQVVRNVDAAGWSPLQHQSDLHLLYILSGTATVHTLEATHGHSDGLSRGDAVTFPRHMAWGLVDCSVDFSFIEVTLPALME